MRNFRLMMSYDGSRYHGFQRQDNALAIQEILEDTIAEIIGEKVTVYGCSRTDTGVHANEFCFNFHHSNTITPDGMVRALNSRLPGDIAIMSCEEVSNDFHARFDCVAKEYIYKIHNSQIKNPFLNNRAYRYFRNIDERLLDTAAKAFVGKHDFTAFCCTASDKEDKTRTIYSFDVWREDDMVYMKVCGDGFLYNMVRIMVGTLLFVNEGKIASDKLPCIIESKDRTKAGKTAPPQGLYLNRVIY